MPHRYCGQTLEAHVYEQVVQLYHQLTLTSTHPRVSGPGQWRTRLEHYPKEKAAYLLNTRQVCRDRAEQIGPSTFQAVDQLLSERPLDRLRSVQALLRLEESGAA